MVPGILILFYFLFPVFIIYLTQKYPFINKIGAVAIAYGAGLIIGSIGIFPSVSESYRELLAGDLFLKANDARELFGSGKITMNDLLRNKIIILQSNINNVSVAIAIPLLLFSLNLRKWFRAAGKTFLSVVLALLSVIVVVYGGYFIFKGGIDELWKVSGMLIGIYSGGTPNVAAIGKALDVDPTIFIITNAYDITIGAFCLLFLITIAQRVFLFFLPPYKKNINNNGSADIEHVTTDIENYSGMFRKNIFLQILLALGISVLVLIISILLSRILPDKYEGAVIILSITSFGLILSLVPGINRLKRTFQAGMYLIIVFCLVIASMADLTTLFRIEYLNLFLYVFLVVFGSLAVHVLLSIVFKIDADTVIITSTAMVYSPPFVPVIAGALGNKDVIISGVTAGMLGYVIGNFLGVFTGNFLSNF